MGTTNRGVTTLEHPELPVSFQLDQPLFRNDEGATAVEYAMLLSLILTVIIAAIGWTGLGSKLLFQNSDQSLREAGLGR
jgi:Flp pilus assembly pilin Flp